MLILDETTNTVKQLEQRSFSSLNLSERNHLQKWILDFPAMLGEDLLIIQEEFDGWRDTRERLDVLAIDKAGQLVIIENKLDDSGRDVVWQAMKYAAYCSSLSKAEIVKIHNEYLQSIGDNEANAADRIAEFLGVEDLSDIDLNEGSGQRVILTAARFRNEVTATALWMIDHGINIKCMRITPYSHNDNILINVEQVIPPIEAQEYMVRVGRKKSEENQDRSRNSDRHILRKRFWSALLPKLTDSAASVFQNRSAGVDHWLSGATGHSGVNHQFHFLKDKLRYDLNIANAATEYNKHAFDALQAEQANIDAAFGAPLIWLRLDDYKSRRISYEISFDSYNEAKWPEAISWLNEHMNRGIAAIQPHLDALK
ncbi:DUF4268 domain-containing protein [Fretibacter rubidus]|uniref:DUF4268 domain-containing protein n=1 Tax=Fretibacter rubidus TaxID=570162 RepID=UPI003529FD03